MTEITSNQHTQREAWLVEATKLMDAKFFTPNTHKLPSKIALSCGWCRGHANAIGQCWCPTVSKNGTCNIFICPTRDDAVDVLQILLHELIHAAVGVQCGHKGAFRFVAKAMGLEGKMTATFVSPGTKLFADLEAMATILGPYPHAAISKKNGKGKKKDHKVRVWSPSDSTYSVLMNRTTFEENGAPVDPWGQKMVVKGEEPGPDDEGEGEENMGRLDREWELEGLDE